MAGTMKFLFLIISFICGGFCSAQSLQKITHLKTQTTPTFAQSYTEAPKLVIELSKPLNYQGDSVDWDQVFLYYFYNSRLGICETFQSYPVNILETSEPEIKKTDSNTYLYTFELETELENFSQECLYINPRGPAGPNKIKTQLLLGIVGGNPPSEQFTRNIGARFQNTNFRGIPRWQGFQQKSTCQGIYEDWIDFPYTCFSSVQFESNDPLQIEVTIFDQFGQLIWESSVEFGKCGELKNKQRKGNFGQYGWLAWPLKDKQGNFVKSGVYIWKIDMRDQNGKTWTQYHHQGVTHLSESQQSTCLSQQHSLGL